MDAGMTRTVARSKTDEEVAGQIVGVIATGSLACPVAALRTLPEAAGITNAAVFRAVNCRIATSLCDRAIALSFKRRVRWLRH
jgi:hypothetical protein